MDEKNKENYNKMKEVSDSISNMRYNRLKQDAEEFKSLVEDAEKEKKSVIPEVVFQQYFLDYFKNLALNKIDKNDEKSDVILKKWIELAGGVYQEVDVLDTKGEVAFTVPAMCTRGTANIDLLKDINFRDMAIDYHRQVSRLPVNRIQIGYEKISQIPQFLVDNSNSKDKQRWRDIFKRYSDKEEKQKKELEVKKGNNMKINTEDLGLDFE